MLPHEQEPKGMMMRGMLDSHGFFLEASRCKTFRGSRSKKLQLSRGQFLRSCLDVLLFQVIRRTC